MIKKLIYKVVLKEISLEIILHAIQKSHFPFPYKTGIGNCNDSCLLRLSEEKNTSATARSFELGTFLVVSKSCKSFRGVDKFSNPGGGKQ